MIMGHDHYFFFNYDVRIKSASDFEKIVYKQYNIVRYDILTTGVKI